VTTAIVSLSIDDLDVIAPGAFAAAVAPLFEGARGFLGRLAVARPFGSVEAMFERSREIAHTMPIEEQLELIDAHPRLGAPPADVSAPSFVEQGYGRGGVDADPEAIAEAIAEADEADEADEAAAAGALPAEADEAAAAGAVAAELERLNAVYEARFGFRYCVFVAGRSRAALVPGMTAALEADRESEIDRALDAVIDIARDRYATLMPGTREKST